MEITIMDSCIAIFKSLVALLTKRNSINQPEVCET